MGPATECLIDRHKSAVRVFGINDHQAEIYLVENANLMQGVVLAVATSGLPVHIATWRATTNNECRFTFA
jgi:hypothetical protein